MTALRRRLIYCILAVFASGAIGYLFWIPYDPASLYRAIPADAVLISSHWDIAARWPQLATNTWAGPFFGAEETSEQNTRAGNSPYYRQSVLRLIRLARRDTLIAYLPDALRDRGGGASESAWMAATWIGGWSPLVRWSLCFNRRPWIKDLGTCGSRTMWGLQRPIAEGKRLSFACGDGVMLACVSSDPAAIRYALMAYDGLIPSFKALPELQTAPGQSGFQDAVWYQWRGAKPFTLTGALTKLDSQGLSAKFRMRPSPYRQAPLSECMDRAGVEQALGNLPALVLTLPLPTVQDALPPPANAPAWLQTTRRILQSDWIRQDTNSLLLALFTGEYSGGYGRKPLRMSIPTLMAFVRVQQPENVKRMLERELDQLNARHRLGLILDPIPLAVGAQAIHTIETTSIPLLASQEAFDRPAYTLVGDWLIISSHAGSLVKLMRRFQTLSSNTAEASAGWHKVMSGTNTSGLAWLDLDSGGKTVQLALSLWGLSRRNATSPSSPPLIKEARRLLDNIRVLNSLTVWMEPEGSNALISVQIGPGTEP